MNIGRVWGLAYKYHRNGENGKLMQTSSCVEVFGG